MNRHEYAAHAALVDAANVERERRASHERRLAARNAVARQRERNRGAWRFVGKLVGLEAALSAVLHFI